MGEYRSGRRGSKSTTNDMHALDLRKIQRAGLLAPGRPFGWQWPRRGNVIASINLHADYDAPLSKLTLDYRTRSRGGEWKDINYLVYISWTGCHYGGQRVWWLCPAVGCRRRVAVLYGGKVCACRYCHKPAYQTQREQARDRAGARADTNRKRLG